MFGSDLEVGSSCSRYWVGLIAGESRSKPIVLMGFFGHGSFLKYFEVKARKSYSARKPSRFGT